MLNINITEKYKLNHDIILEELWTYLDLSSHQLLHYHTCSHDSPPCCSCLPAVPHQCSSPAGDDPAALTMLLPPASSSFSVVWKIFTIQLIVSHSTTNLIADELHHNSCQLTFSSLSSPSHIFRSTSWDTRWSVASSIYFILIKKIKNDHLQHITERNKNKITYIHHIPTSLLYIPITMRKLHV